MHVCIINVFAYIISINHAQKSQLAKLPTHSVYGIARSIHALLVSVNS